MTKESSTIVLFILSLLIANLLVEYVLPNSTINWIRTFAHEETHYLQIKALGVQNVSWRFCELNEMMWALDFTEERNVTIFGHCYGVTQFSTAEFYSKFDNETEALKFLHQSGIDARSNEPLGVFIFEFIIGCIIFKMLEGGEKNERVCRISRI